MIRWTVYSRIDCSLCEQLLHDLTQILGPASPDRLETIDIAGEPDLERRFGHRIPVLYADGEFVCAYRLDQARVEQLIGREA